MGVYSNTWPGGIIGVRKMAQGSGWTVDEAGLEHIIAEACERNGLKRAHRPR